MGDTREADSASALLVDECRKRGDMVKERSENTKVCSNPDQQLQKKHPTAQKPKSSAKLNCFRNKSSIGDSANSEEKKLHRMKYFDFGEPCNECSSKEITELSKTIKADIRCPKCFRIICLYNACSEDNDCKMLNEIIKKKTSEMTDVLWKRVLDKRQSEDFVVVQCFTSERIHRTKVETTVRLSKYFKGTKKGHGDNIIRMDITGYDGQDDINVDTKQAVYVRLGDKLGRKIVGLYEKGGTDIELKLLKSFEENLATESVKLPVVKDVLGYFTKCTEHLIAVCLLQSRMKEDVKYTLENIRENDYRRVILVLLHFKINDTDCRAEELQAEQCYSDLSIIDYFQQQGKENLKEVIDKIKAIIFGC